MFLIFRRKTIQEIISCFTWIRKVTETVRSHLVFKSIITNAVLLLQYNTIQYFVDNSP